MDNELNYAKQSQFAGHSNERKLLFQQSIMKIYGFSNAVKNKPNQTQLQTNHPIFKISLKNPNFLKIWISLVLNFANLDCQFITMPNPFR